MLSRTVVLLLGMVVLVTSMTAHGKPPEFDGDEAEATALAPVRQWKAKLIDAGTGDPISNARVTVNTWTDGVAGSKVETLTTTKGGLFTVPIRDGHATSMTVQDYIEGGLSNRP